MNRLSVTIGDRTVYWDLDVDLLSVMMAQFVAGFGPADGEEE